MEEMPGAEKIPGEKIYLNCEFVVATAKEDGCFNAATTCSYGFTVDTVARDTVLQKKRQGWKDEGKKEEEIEFETKNWLLLDGMRIYKKDSFDFEIQSVGIHTNYELLNKSCDILLKRLDNLDTLIEQDKVEITNSLNTLANSYDVILEKDDYTIGKIIEYFLYSKFYETEILTFCGFKKMHPHDTDSIIRLAYKETVEKHIVKQHLRDACMSAAEVFKSIYKMF
jgi:DNA-directed RNA polymerase subunit L